ncbi:helix-turn-helix domain-containing protein [Chryseobacterium sp. G0240]|uniref:helix-turn-helix domain-containing protein n=1 Tax=Chryseobacterium sp. G0240 TaxID=2487066 RepID=UPI0011CE132C|nr:helix-turn-helix domain-containing protein [Chryseobacterium sp. G0240]
MNIYIMSLLDSIIQQNIIAFSRLESVRSMEYFANPELLSQQLSVVSDFYLSFLQQLKFIPIGAYKLHHNGHYNLKEKKTDNKTILQAIQKINETEFHSNDIIPIQLRYSDKYNLHFVAGIVRIETKKSAAFHLVDLFLPKRLITSVPQNIGYVRDILNSYTKDMKDSKRTNSRKSIVEYVTSEGYYYNRFLKDFKAYFGDTFYSFILKKRIIEAVGDMIFTAKSLKVIAFENGFEGYKTMHKAFKRYEVPRSKIPKLV